jgi:hypothetical protein
VAASTIMTTMTASAAWRMGDMAEGVKRATRQRKL